MQSRLIECRRVKILLCMHYPVIIAPCKGYVHKYRV